MLLLHKNLLFRTSETSIIGNVKAEENEQHPGRYKVQKGLMFKASIRRPFSFAPEPRFPKGLISITDGAYPRYDGSTSMFCEVQLDLRMDKNDSTQLVFRGDSRTITIDQLVYPVKRDEYPFLPKIGEVYILGIHLSEEVG